MMIFPYFSVPTIKPQNFELDKKSPFTAETATFVWDSIPADSPDLKGKFDGYVVSNVICFWGFIFYFKSAHKF